MNPSRFEPATDLPSRRRFFNLAGAGLAVGTLALWGQFCAALPSQANALTTATALDAHLRDALAKKRPLVVMVSLHGCPFCKMARENYLLPLVRQGAIEVVQVDMQSQRELRDLQGQWSSHARVIEKWQIRIAPTLLFIGAKGEEVAERLVGGYLPDFYGAYLDNRLARALQAVGV